MSQLQNFNEISVLTSEVDNGISHRGISQLHVYLFKTWRRCL